MSSRLSLRDPCGFALALDSLEASFLPSPERIPLPFGKRGFCLGKFLRQSPRNLDVHVTTLRH